MRCSIVRKRLDRNSLLMLVAFHFVANSPAHAAPSIVGSTIADGHVRISDPPGARMRYASRKHRFRFRQMLEHRQHHDMIELPGFQRQRRA